jgi:DnaA family protein
MDHIEVLPVSESNLKEALKFITNIKSMRVGDNEINYLITHSNRNFSRLVKIIDELDIASIKLKRKITIPLIKEII